MRELEIETEAVLHEENLLYGKTRKTKPTPLPHTRQNGGELRVRENTDEEREIEFWLRENMNEERGNRDRTD